MEKPILLYSLNYLFILKVWGLHCYGMFKIFILGFCIYGRYGMRHSLARDGGPNAVRSGKTVTDVRKIGAEVAIGHDDDKDTYVNE